MKPITTVKVSFDQESIDKIEELIDRLLSAVESALHALDLLEASGDAGASSVPAAEVGQ